MKTTNEYTDEIIKRGNDKIAKKRKSLRIIISACSCLLLCSAVAIGVLLLNSGDNKKIPTDTNDSSMIFAGDFTPITDDSSSSMPDVENDDSSKPASESSTADSNVIVQDKEPVFGDDGSFTSNACLVEWEGKSIMLNLSNSFEKEDENTLFAITAQYLYIDGSFEFEGKTLAQYDEERGDEWLTIQKLGCLMKEGEELKLGEKLVTEGLPNGTKWAESWYKERTQWYGEEFLNKYIVDGEFLLDKAEADAKALETQPAAKLYEKALGQYRIHAQTENLKYFNDMGIPGELRESSYGLELVIYATRSQFESIELKNDEYWYFGLALKEGDAEDFGVVETEPTVQPSND